MVWLLRVLLCVFGAHSNARRVRLPPSSGISLRSQRPVPLTAGHTALPRSNPALGETRVLTGSSAAQHIARESRRPHAHGTKMYPALLSANRDLDHAPVKLETNRDLEHAPVKLEPSSLWDTFCVKTETLLPASVALVSFVLGLAAWLAAKPIITAVMAVLLITSALITSWTAGFVDATEQSESQVEKIIAAREQEWAELQLARDAVEDEEEEEEEEDEVEEEQEPGDEIPPRRKRDILWHAVKKVFYGDKASDPDINEGVKPTSNRLDVSQEGSSDSPSPDISEGAKPTSDSLDVSQEESSDSPSPDLSEGAKPTSNTLNVSQATSSDSPSFEEMTAPGMDEANLVVNVPCDRQTAEASSKKEGVRRLLDKSLGEILSAMAQKDWRVEPKNPAEGIYTMFLPSVKVDFPVGSVSIPSPEFEVSVRDSYVGSGDDDEEERLVGDLVLQNGKDILTVSLKFPLSTQFSVSAAGAAFARIGRFRDGISFQSNVKIGLQIPKVPGIVKIMQIFVRNYAKQSSYDCAVALSKAADKTEAGAEAAEQTGVAVATAAAAIIAEEDVAGIATALGEAMAQGAQGGPLL